MKNLILMKEHRNVVQGLRVTMSQRQIEHRATMKSLWFYRCLSLFLGTCVLCLGTYIYLN
jgi:hypothetical protein